MIENGILEILCCPICFSDLSRDEYTLKCNNCKIKYPIYDEIPLMIPKRDIHDILDYEKEYIKSPPVNKNLQLQDIGWYRNKFLPKIFQTEGRILDVAGGGGCIRIFP